MHFWNPGGEKVVAGHVCSLPTGHLLSSQVACLNHLFPLCRDGKASTLLLRELHPDMVEALPVGIHARDMFVEFEVTGGGSYLNEEQRGQIADPGRQRHIRGCGHERTGCPGNIRLFLIEWKYTENYHSRRKKDPDSGMDAQLWRYRSFFTRDGSPFTFCNSDVDTTFFKELLIEPYYQLMRQTLLGWKMTQDPSRNGQATSFTHIVVIPHGNTALRSGCAGIAGRQGGSCRGLERTCPGTRALPCARGVAASVDDAAGLCPAAGLSLPPLLAGRALLFIIIGVRAAPDMKKGRSARAVLVVSVAVRQPYRLAATLRSRRASWLVKPDSLSYQMMSLAMVPSMTWVDRASTTPP